MLTCFSKPSGIIDTLLTYMRRMFSREMTVSLCCSCRRVAVHEKSRLVGVELPGRDVSILHRLEEQPSAVWPATEHDIGGFRPYLRTHFSPLGEQGLTYLGVLAGTQSTHRSGLDTIRL